MAELALRAVHSQEEVCALSDKAPRSAHRADSPETARSGPASSSSSAPSAGQARTFRKSV